MTRLQNAGKVLTFPLPVSKIERNPNVSEGGAFWVQYEANLHDGHLSCSPGNGDDCEMGLDPPAFLAAWGSPKRCETSTWNRIAEEPPAGRTSVTLDLVSVTISAPEK